MNTAPRGADGRWTPSPVTRVFVYGSLLSGLYNNGWLDGARLVGPAKTADATWTMLNLGSFPGVVTGGSDQIIGEVYEVDAAMLSELDRLESAPSFYYRKPVNMSDGTAALMYILNCGTDRAYGNDEIRSGNWRAYVAAAERRSECTN